jgi:hypothetical protein
MLHGMYKITVLCTLSQWVSSYAKLYVDLPGYIVSSGVSTVEHGVWWLAKVNVAAQHTERTLCA